jgi:DNA alkylation repair enzyme
VSPGIPLPAIYPARLQNQITQLAELYGQPAQFTHALTDLLELYSNRAHRSGQAGEPPPLLRTYNVPKPVIRQLMLELQPLADEYPTETLDLIVTLWAEETLETRQIAAFLLGSIPSNPPETILNIISEWLNTKPEEHLISLILHHTLVRIRKENPATLFTQIDTWLSNEKLSEQQIGLKALKAMLTSNELENFPQFIQLLTPYTRKAPLQIRADILDALSTLASRTPKETAYLLRQSLNSPENPDTALLIRKLLPFFPPDLQESLKQVLREARG